MEKVVIDISEHACSRSEVVEGAFEPLGVGAILGGGDGGVGRSNLKYNGGLLVCDRRLSSQLVGECIAPREVDSDLGEAQLEELELPKVLVQQVLGFTMLVKKTVYDKVNASVISLPAPLTASCLHLWRFAHSVA